MGRRRDPVVKQCPRESVGPPDVLRCRVPFQTKRMGMKKP